jgi:hypothetical protein
MTSRRLFSNITIAGALVSCLLTSCEKDSENSDVVVISANGNISAKVDEFRQLLGSQLNTAPGAVGGRREINWEGVPDSLLGKTLPNDFFNPAGNDPTLAARQRGIQYEPTGNFMVSNAGFAEINSQAAGEFAAFSGSKTFANITGDLWSIVPEVPGQDVAATVKGFGIVFSDVDVTNSTFIEFFNEQKSLGKFFVPVRAGGSSHSFLGVYFKKEKVTRIKVGHDGVLGDGQKDVSQQQGAHDLVVLDDFLYDEPVQK